MADEYKCLCEKLDLPMSMVTRALIDAFMKSFADGKGFSFPFVCLTKSEYERLLEKAGKKAKK